MVKTSPSTEGGVGSASGQEAKIPHALQPKSHNIEEKQYCSKFNKDFKNGPHQKNILRNDSSAKSLLYFLSLISKFHVFSQKP